MDLSDYGSEAIVSREQLQQLTTYHPKSKLFLFVEKAPGFRRIRQFDALKFQPSALRLSGEVFGFIFLSVTEVGGGGEPFFPDRLVCHSRPWRFPGR